MFLPSHVHAVVSEVSIPAISLRTCLLLQNKCAGCRGGGATLNGKQIHVSQIEDLGSALVATELGTTRDPAGFAAVTQRLATFAEATHSLRSCLELADAQ